MSRERNDGYRIELILQTGRIGGEEDTSRMYTMMAERERESERGVNMTQEVGQTTSKLY